MSAWNEMVTFARSRVDLHYPAMECKIARLPGKNQFSIKPGMRFGLLAVLARVDSDGKEKRYLCLCSCSEKKTVSGGSLRSGKVKSCGCLRRANGRKAMNKHWHEAA